MRQLTSPLVLVLAAAACGNTTADVPPGKHSADGGSSFHESGGSGGSKEPSSGASGGSATPKGGSGTDETVGGTAGSRPVAGSGATDTAGAAAGSPPLAGSNSGGSGGMANANAYAPRSGRFKTVVFSKTAGFRHDSSIAAGKLMLGRIAEELGIDAPLFTEEPAFLDNVDAYELVFFMNTSGDIFNAAQEAQFEAWMRKGGAFCGTHSATDTDNGWLFYEEVTGQYYEGHGVANEPGSIVFEASALGHPALAGLPNPWQRQEEWLRFTRSQAWSAKPGFKILARKAADQEPVIWLREHDNYRAFYSGIGNAPEVFEDPDVEKHLTGAIMWAVRREHCVVLPKPATCP